MEKRERRRLRPGPRKATEERETRRNTRGVELNRTKERERAYGTWYRRTGSREGRTQGRTRRRNLREPTFEGKTSKKERAEEERVRVGTGYRMRREGTTRRLDVGFSDVKTYERPQGVSARVGSNQTTCVVHAEGSDAAVRVGNVVDRLRKIRRRNPYTGTGRVRKSDRRTRKRKPMKKEKA